MKTKLFILALLCLCINAKLFAQNNNGNKSKIYGTVKDSESGSPLEFTTAILMTGADSTIVGTTISDQNGAFVFNNVPAGSYKLKLAFMGYLDADQDLQVAPNQKELEAKVSSLKPIDNQLDAAVVTVKVPLIERKIDKLIMNVEGAVSTEGSNALDVLKKAPGVTVDHEGNIKLLGSGVLVQIDGRETYLSSSDLSTMLNGMEASDISKIEIINSPSSKQDASGSSGIINIRTRKSVMAGINGSINAGFTAAKYWGYYGGGRINYRNAWMGAYASLNYRDNKHLETIDKTQIFRQTTLALVRSSQSNNRANGENINYRFGLDFYLNPKNTLGFLLTGNNSDEKITSLAQMQDAVGTVVNLKSNSNNNTNGDNNGLTFNANYRKLFNKDGQSLTFDFDYVKFKDKQKGNRNDLFYDMLNKPDSTSLIRTYSPRTIEVFSGKTDYAQPIGTTAQLEAGAKVSYSRTNSSLNWENNFTGMWENDDKRSSDFEYDERVTAAYASIGKQFNDKFSIKAGFRWENTWSKGYSPTTGDEKIRKYDDFFPTIFAQYKPWEKHDFSITYNRRIQRPNYNDLNPFRFYIDAFTYIAGNSKLKPQYTNNFNITYSYNNMIISTLLYQRQVDLVVQIPEQSGDMKESGVIKDNFGYNDMIGINISIPHLPITKWWALTANIWGAWSHGHNKQDSTVYDNYIVMARGYMSSNFTFLKTWRAEYSINASTPTAWGTFKIKSNYWMSIGLKKSFFDNKLNLSVNFDDPFNINKSSIHEKYDKYDNRYESRWLSQRVRVGLTWNFGSTKLKPIQDRRGGNQDELSRIKSE